MKARLKMTILSWRGNERYWAFDLLFTGGGRGIICLVEAWRFLNLTLTTETENKRGREIVIVRQEFYEKYD